MHLAASSPQSYLLHPLPALLSLSHHRDRNPIPSRSRPTQAVLVFANSMLSLVARILEVVVFGTLRNAELRVRAAIAPILHLWPRARTHSHTRANPASHTSPTSTHNLPSAAPSSSPAFSLTHARPLPSQQVLQSSLSFIMLKIIVIWAASEMEEATPTWNWLACAVVNGWLKAYAVMGRARLQYVSAARRGLPATGGRRVRPSSPLQPLYCLSQSWRRATLFAAPTLVLSSLFLTPSPPPSTRRRPRRGSWAGGSGGR